MEDENKATDFYNPEDNTTDQIIDDYKDMPIELVQPSRKRFLTWGDFDNE